MTDSYKLVLSKASIRSLSKLYNIKPRKVFLQSKYILTQHPHKKAYVIVNYPGSDFNGYYWVLIKNVVIIKKQPIQRKVNYNKCGLYPPMVVM
jgi:hypothetical protein